jgi:MoxR-like ATPase
MHVRIDYPDDASEREIIRLVRGEARAGGAVEPERTSQKIVFEARGEIDSVEVSEAVESYIVSLIAATRRPEGYGEDLKRWLLVGASPRGSIALDAVSRAHAWLQERDYVTPDDVRAVVHDCLRHRIILSYEANAEGVTADQVIGMLVKEVAVA